MEYFQIIVLNSFKLLCCINYLFTEEQLSKTRFIYMDVYVKNVFIYNTIFLHGKDD